MILTGRPSKMSVWLTAFFDTIFFDAIFSRWTVVSGATVTPCQVGPARCFVLGAAGVNILVGILAYATFVVDAEGQRRNIVLVFDGTLLIGSTALAAKCFPIANRFVAFLIKVRVAVSRT